jgi:glycosyltransferase involved in cell wall biosynthesis
MSRIDVVIPCYNYGRFLRQCAESVLAQSHPDLRVLVIDDASTDETAEIAADLAREDRRLTFRRHSENRGHICSYNEGIAWAEGDYMLVLDADDVLLPGALERAASVLDADARVGLVYGPAMTFQTRNPLTVSVYRPWNLNGSDGAATSPIEGLASSDAILVDSTTFIEALLAGNHVPQSSAVVRTTLQKRLGGYCPTLPHSGDLEMWVRFALHARVAYIHALQAVYRRHESNMSLSYAGVADLWQFRDAFAMHYRHFRERLPGGAALERRARRQFAALARRWSRLTLRRGRFSPGLQLAALALRESSTAMLAERIARAWLRRPSPLDADGLPAPRTAAAMPEPRKPRDF